MLQRNGITLPRLRLPRLLPRQVYPAPKAEQSNELHQVELGGGQPHVDLRCRRGPVPAPERAVALAATTKQRKQRRETMKGQRRESKVGRWC
jgi:hypothetical protein